VSDPEPAPGHPEIERIVAPNPGPMTLEGTNTFVVGADPPFVIDPGPADEGHIAAVRAAAERRGGLGPVLLTHTHGDHADGVELLGGEVLDPREGEGVGPFSVIATPGHAADHVCLLMGGVCFTGDLILGEGSTFVPPDGGSLTAYLNSLRRLLELELELLCPGHGPYVTEARAKVEEYLEHRLERERRLVAALDAGERSRAGLLGAAWGDVPEAMRPAAAVVMQAHLEKLEAEGRLPELRD
jgi:glyoxylase-like metal-dependent hydrolase (beta-lactamase superfamily II)